MEYVLCLIGNPSRGGLPPAMAGAAGAALRQAGARCGDPAWLDENVACDIGFDAIDPAAADAAARSALGELPVDLAVLPAANRRKRLLVADMDSTIIDVECIDELAACAGLKPQVAAITERAMRGELDFRASLVERVRMLHGLDEGVLAVVYRERVRLNPGARTLVATMRANGAYTALVSGGFTYFTKRVRDAVGFDYDQANVLESADGRLSGTIAEPILDAGAKLAALRRISAERSLPGDATLAVGDGANDLPMIQAAGLGVAFRAKPIVAAAAQVRVQHADLTALLYLQGYRRSEFAERST